MKKKSLKTVGVKELKNNLSAYLREVRGGSTVLITDRNDIVAELHEPFTRTNVAGAMDPQLQAWVESGLVTLPTVDKEPLRLSFVCHPAGTTKALIENERKESGE